MFIASLLLSIPFACAASDALDSANARTRQFLRQTMQEQRIPGVQIAVVKDNRIVLSESYGLANVENRVPLATTTLLPINSATKSFTGVAVMQLAEAGLVQIDAPISRYLNDLPEAWRGVRVRQLLAHTSGLPNIVDRQGLIGGGTEREAWKAVKERPLDAPVGDKFAYTVHKVSRRIDTSLPPVTGDSMAAQIDRGAVAPIPMTFLALVRRFPAVGR